MNIKVAVIGVGSMGKGLAYQIEKTPGLECVALADISVDKCLACARWLGKASVIANNKESMNAHVRNGRLAVTRCGELVSQCGPVDVVIEASSSIVDGLRYCESALQNGKHLVMMNAEVDLTFGPYLLDLARTNGVTYTSCDGDQHGVIKRLVDDVELWGFELVMAGNIKGFLDKYSNPQKIVPEADKRNLDYKMATAYTDGTKLAIEMALVSNALGLRPNKGAMIGPKASHVSEALKLFNLQEIREGTPVVDYLLGAEPGGGVFVIGYCDNPYQMDMMKYYKMGDGPYYVFYRPYHLCHVEAMQCVFDAVQGRSLLQPNCGMMANVYACAKTDLNMGARLDGVGGHTCYGAIQEKKSRLLPICLSENLVLRKAIQKDVRITIDDVDCKSIDRYVWERYKKACE